MIHLYRLITFMIIWFFIGLIIQDNVTNVYYVMSFGAIAVMFSEVINEFVNPIPIKIEKEKVK